MSGILWHEGQEIASADASGGGAAIEAPFIYKKGKCHYLFVSFDLCCPGAKSTYKINRWQK
jgi:beta-xylosidase